MENKIKPEVKLDSWELVPFTRGDGTVSHVLYGNALDHPNFFIGQYVRTSRVLFIDFEKRTAETLNTRYVLLTHRNEEKNETI